MKRQKDNPEVTVEFFGIVRARTGIAMKKMRGETLGDIIQQVSDEYPEFARDCADGCQLRSGFAANMNGAAFVTDSSTLLAEGDVVMLMSLDAGG